MLVFLQPHYVEELSLPVFITKIGIGFDTMSLLLVVILTKGQGVLLLLAGLGMILD